MPVHETLPCPCSCISLFSQLLGGHRGLQWFSVSSLIQIDNSVLSVAITTRVALKHPCHSQPCYLITVKHCTWSTHIIQEEDLFRCKWMFKSEEADAHLKAASFQNGKFYHLLDPYRTIDLISQLDKTLYCFGLQQLSDINDLTQYCSYI